MIRITPTQAQALDDAVDVEAAIAAWLPRQYPTPFASIDDGQRKAMARAGCRRAEAWGATSSKAKFAFAGLMAAVAPDFDRHPSVQAALSKTGVEEPVLSLDKTLPSSVWGEVEASASSIGWRLDQVFWDATPKQRVDAATPATLAGSGLAPVRPTHEALELVRDFGRVFAPGGETALFVLTLWTSLHRDPRPMVDDTLDRARNVQRAVQSLALRLSLDFGLWI